MRRLRSPFSRPSWALSVSFALAMALGIAACSDDSGETPTPSDAAVDGKVDPEPDATAKPDAPIATAFKVAAVQYSSGNYSAAQGCSDDICGVSHFVREAANNGAKVIATPEYAQDQKTSEAAPAMGDVPATDARWADGSIIKAFSKLSAELKVTVVFNVITQDSGKLYNTNIATDDTGKVVARHYKFQLFGGEDKQLTAGPNIENSFFQTPAGLAGTMICADAQCIVTKLNVSQDCTAHSIQQLKDYFAKKPKVIFFSAFWTVGGTGIWAALNVQKQVAENGVWLVGSNNTKGDGKGGAIYKPGGEEVAKHFSDKPGIIYAEIPFEK